MSARIVVVSCPKRKPLQQIWRKCFEAGWPDCPYPVTLISPENDVGWNANLIACLETISEQFVLLILDDNFIEPNAEYTANMERVIETMTKHSDIGLMKLQAGGAHAPEIEFADWKRVREYDRRPHPFKRTNLVPAMYRRSWLLRFCRAVLKECGPQRDKGRDGALEFEITGTRLTEDRANWPERMFGIHRPNADGGGGDALLVCYANDGVTAGKIRPFLAHLCEGVEGAEVYL